MFERINLVKSIFTTSLFIIVFCSCTTNSLISPALQEKLSRVALDGYTELKQGNHQKADSLFMRVLNLASDYDWPVFNSKGINETMPKWIQEHKYDWQGSNAQKIMGLMQVYCSVKNYFGGFELSPQLNWDSLVINCIPKVIEVENIEEYYRLLLRLIANLNDNHTWLRPPSSLEERIDKPPITIEYIANKFLITEVQNTEENRREDIYPGLEIKKVEGVLARDYFMENKLPYISLSRTQRERFYETSNLLSGNRNSKVEITVIDSSGKEREVTLTRNAKIQNKNENLALVQTKEIDSEIVYFNFTAFWPIDSVVEKFEQEFDRFDMTKVKGLILDVRYNEGGNSRCGDVIISHLIENSFDAWSFKARTKGIIEVISDSFIQFFARTINSLLRKEWYYSNNTISPSSGKRYLGPVVVLISRYTGSAAEQFVVAARESKRAILIGEITSGGTGDGVFSILPDYGKLKVCVGLGSYMDGKIWQGKGIEPDIEISRTVEDIRNGYDPVLAKAIEVLRDSTNKK